MMRYSRAMQRLAFIVAMIGALLRELKIDCGCFGKEHATPVSWMKVWEDVGLLILGAYSYLVSRLSDRKKMQDSVPLPL